MTVKWIAEINKKKMQLFGLCLLTCLLTVVSWTLMNNSFLMEANKPSIDACFEEIMKTSKEAFETADLRALDILASNVQKWLERNKHLNKQLPKQKLHSNSNVEDQEFRQKMKSKFGSAIYKNKVKTDGSTSSESSDEENFNTQKNITVLLNFHSYEHKYVKDMKNLLKDIKVLFPGVSIVVNSPFNLQLDVTVQNVTLISRDTESDAGTIWNHLFERVETTYVLLLKNVIAVDANLDLDNLLEKLLKLEADAVGGAVKYRHNGHWEMGCFQTAYRNYALVYKTGYRKSKYSCVFCNSISGPFLTKTTTLKKYFSEEDLSDELVFHDFFFSLFQEKYLIAVCPDNMFTLRRLPPSPNRLQWLPFAKKNNAHKIVTSKGTSMEYTCKELQVDNNADDTKNAPLCAMKELTSHVKFIMRLCKENFIVCELTDGTQLEAVKLNDIPPYELDADIAFYSPQANELWDLKPKFEAQGYSLYYHKYTGEFDSPWFRSSGEYWRVDLFNRSYMDSVQQILEGKNPTKVMFCGEWVHTSNNVGRTVLSYGSEVYQHYDYFTNTESDHHFSRCKKEDEHDCVDLNPTDGNLGFGDPVP